MFNSNLKRVTIHADVVRFDRFEGGQLDGCSASDIEAGAVARALDLVTLELALIERAAIMRAKVIDRVELPVHVAHCHVMIADAKYGDPFGRNVGCRANGLPRSHYRER